MKLRSRLFRGVILASLATTRAAPLILIVSVAQARPGAGNTYRAPSTPSRSSSSSGSSSSSSRSSSSSSSGSSSDRTSWGWGKSASSGPATAVDDHPLAILFWLVFTFPFAALVVVVAAAEAAKRTVGRLAARFRSLFGKNEGASADEWSTDNSAFDTVPLALPPIRSEPAPVVPKIARQTQESVPAAIAALGGADPGFTEEGLRGLVAALYAAVSRCAEGHLDDLAPYLAAPARGYFHAFGKTGGAAPSHVSGVTLDEVFTTLMPVPRVHVRATVRGGGNVESWTLSRSPTATTKLPSEALALGCPTCGVPIEAGGNVQRAGRCAACEQTVDDGSFGWLVTAVRSMGPDTEAQTYRDVPAAIAALGGKDEDFSWIVFEDFVSALYVSTHHLRGENRLEDLAAYLSPEARTTLGAGRSVRVSLPVLGAMRALSFEAFTLPAPQVRVVLDLEGNYTETPRGSPIAAEVGGADGAAKSYIAVERWSLVRSPDAVSRKPAEARLLECPSCGAAVGAKELSERGVHCAYCKELVDTGAFDWLVESVQLMSREERDDQLTGDVQEAGTDRPTRFDPNAEAAYAALLARDPTQEWAALSARATLVFDTFQMAWSSLDLEVMRPFLSDNLFEIQPRFVEAYRAPGLRNVTTGTSLFRLEPVRLLHDRHYDALTIRMHARGLDYTLDASERVVAGSKTEPRSYTEYWTFIRSAERRGAPRLDVVCPSCGAPNDLEMAGSCGVCHAKITSGAFDWVLARIEQDESYLG